MSSTKSDMCLEVEDSLADILDGFAPTRLIDHIAECDGCRDKRYEAERAAEAIEHAGADFRPSEDFAERMIAAVLEARPGAPGGAKSTDAARESLEPAPGALDTRVSGTAPTELAAASREGEAKRGDGGGTVLDAPTMIGGGIDDARTVFEPNKLEGSPESVARESEAFVPTTKTIPLAAVLGRGEASQLTPMPESPARVVDAVTGKGHDTASSGERGASGVAASAREAQAPSVAADDSAIDLQLEKPAPKVAAPKVSAQPVAPVVSLFRRRGFVAAVVGSMAAAAAVGYFVVGKKHPWTAPQPTTAFVDGAWSGTVESVARASADGNTGGLEVCGADKGAQCKTVAQGGAIEAGSTLRTDARTRARFKLADGTVLAMDRGSEVVLPSGASREARVESGMVVVDVAKADKAAPAKFVLPQGQVEVVGTKLSITTTDRRSSVEVARGEVKITSAGGQTTSVRAGEEAILPQSGECVVAPKRTMSDMLEWSDQSQETLDAAALRGIGELRAKKPGDAQEKDHAVRLAKHAVKVRVVDVVARTEVDETFTNDSDDELEGIFRFPLPPDAQIEKLSLEVDGKLVDGAFVDRDKGAAIWRGVIHNAAPTAPKPREEIIWVPGPWRDPALLEWQRGGRFELHIFPIPKHGSRRVVLSYTQTVPVAGGVRRFSYPLAHDAAGTTKIDDFSMDVQVLGNDKDFGVTTRGYTLAKAAGTGDAERFSMSEKNFVPAGDLTVEYALPDRNAELTAWAYQMAPDAAATQSAPVTNGAPLVASSTKSKAEREKQAKDEARALSDDASPYVAIAVRPKLPRWGEGHERLHVIVVDSSRSMVGERFARATHLASSLVREMDRRDSFMVLACDTTCQGMGAAPGRPLPEVREPSADAAEDVERFLGSIEPDGGSNLFAAVQAARAVSAKGKDLRVIYLGDGTPTVGPTKPATVEAAIRQALPPGQGEVVAVALGADADTTTLAAMARGGNGVVVPYVPGQKVSAASVDVLAAAYGSALSDVSVELPPGLTEVTPARMDSIPAGGEAFIFARMTGSQVEGNVKVRGHVGGDAFEQSYPAKIVATTAAGNAFVPRMFAAAKIADLERTGRVEDKERIVALSQRFAVASRFTSMIVLESEAMFKAFGLDKSNAAPEFTGETRATSNSVDLPDDASTADEEQERDKSKDEKKSSASRGRGALDDLDTGAPASEAAAGPGLAGGKGDGFGSGGVHASPKPQGAPAPAPTTMSAPPAKVAQDAAPSDPFGPGWNQPQPNLPPPPPRRPPNMIPMRKVFDRKATFAVGNALATDLASALSDAEAASKASPDSRDKTVAFYKLLMASGRVGEAQELTARWAQRDALDVDALTARADLAAMAGDRERAVRILSGIADVRPGDKAVQLRLANAFMQMGARDLACQNRIAIADMDASDVNNVAGAVRCSLDLGFSGLSSAIRDGVDTSLRDRVDAAVKTVKFDPPLVSGDVRVTATWSAPVDLDLALIDRNGKRISWLGSPLKNVSVSASDATSSRTETLGVSGLNAGSFVVEVVRAAPSSQPVTGELSFVLPGGETRKVPFTLSGNRVEVGSMRVFFTARLVPLDGGGWNGGGGWRGGPVF